MNTGTEIVALKNHGILLPSGEVDTAMLNHLSGGFTGPFLNMLWEMSDGNADVLNRLYSILSGLHRQGVEDEAMDILQLLHEMLGVKFPDSISLLACHAGARSYFLGDLLLDMEDVIQEILADE